MTPFGRRIRELRAERGVTQKDMAAALGVSAAWLSALEKGHRGRPSWNFIQRVIAYFNIIWDDADELARLAHISHPRVVVDTSELSADATELANLIADHVGELSEEDLRNLIHEMKRLVEQARRANR
ncbi:MAG: helix-turn-helix domain-containing protein [Salaquimonas sp.]|jgi:transcriptional regulator with XRE-family HTH domain|nr:helix-turn-helix domain-containing protein [Salaquimonas sp.]